MAKPTTIALSPEALAALKKRYGSGLTAQEYLPGARFVSQGKVQEMAASGPQARVQKYRELVAKTGLSQGEEDVMLTMSLFGTPEEHARRQAEDRISAGLADAAKNEFNTPLSPQEETAFQAWKMKVAPKDSGQDYDLRGAWLVGETPSSENGQWTDRFKKPNHPTFSDQSIYAPLAPELAGSWRGEEYIPSAYNVAGAELDASRIYAKRARTKAVSAANAAFVAPVVPSPVEAPYKEPEDVTRVREMNWGKG